MDQESILDDYFENRIEIEPEIIKKRLYELFSSRLVIKRTYIRKILTAFGLSQLRDIFEVIYYLNNKYKETTYIYEELLRELYAEKGELTSKIKAIYDNYGTKNKVDFMKTYGYYDLEFISELASITQTRYQLKFEEMCEKYLRYQDYEIEGEKEKYKNNAKIMQKIQEKNTIVLINNLLV